jgi:undecaprenyl diphosphate synthase
LLLNYLKDAENSLADENVVIRTIGSRKELSQEIQEQIIKTENFTSKNTGIVMNIALNYGAREEIVNAAKQLCEDVKNGKKNTEDITDKDFSECLYTKNQPDVDLLIRTSGEQRLSDFMLWQVSYAEMWFTHKLWPDFKPRDLRQAICDFQNRGRRFGGV